MAQAVEHVLGKDEVTSSNLVSSSTYSSLAQSVERVTVNHDAVGSSPTGGAIKKSHLQVAFFNGFFLLHLHHQHREQQSRLTD